MWGGEGEGAQHTRVPGIGREELTRKRQEKEVDGAKERGTKKRVPKKKLWRGGKDGAASGGSRCFPLRGKEPQNRPWRTAFRSLGQPKHLKGEEGMHGSHWQMTRRVSRRFGCVPLNSDGEGGSTDMRMVWYRIGKQTQNTCEVMGNGREEKGKKDR